MLMSQVKALKAANPKKAEQSHHLLTAVGKAKGQDTALV